MRFNRGRNSAEHGQCNRRKAREKRRQDAGGTKPKREFLAEWVKAVNQHGGFGQWVSDVSHHPKDVAGILQTHG